MRSGQPCNAFIRLSGRLSVWPSTWPSISVLLAAASFRDSCPWTGHPSESLSLCECVSAQASMSWAPVQDKHSPHLERHVVWRRAEPVGETPNEQAAPRAAWLHESGRWARAHQSRPRFRPVRGGGEDEGQARGNDERRQAGRSYAFECVRSWVWMGIGDQFTAQGVVHARGCAGFKIKVLASTQNNLIRPRHTATPGGWVTFRRTLGMWDPAVAGCILTAKVYQNSNPTNQARKDRTGQDRTKKEEEKKKGKKEKRNAVSPG
ncbi:hypothetical protein BD289DRAFT_116427 [Coniella lustricola]|uniref:Uncharacterized protein n=1 Tax=Coniella lustricola TaxID=2025994 RepID=A0A2T2ZWX1_9PEZI|nr:hypothetical protein BD289DRAFT_116427 [Coniella lustricola]